MGRGLGVDCRYMKHQRPPLLGRGEEGEETSGGLFVYIIPPLAVSEILCVDRVYSVSLFGISELIPKISNQIGWQIG